MTERNSNPTVHPYPTLELEMKRIGLTGRKAAAGLGINHKSFSRRLRGVSEFRLWEALYLKRTYFPDKSIEELFG